MPRPSSPNRWPTPPLLLAMALAAGACEGLAREAPPPPPPEDGSRLVLVVAVDQARHDYLERFRPLLSGGLAWLLDEGVVFTDAHQDHATTVTGAGHASLATGMHPARSGIISNRWYDPDTGEDVYCVGDPVFYRSPRNLEVSALPDWIQERDPESKVFSAAGKDRSAILLGGHDAEMAFWYDASSGEWITSRYYQQATPRWVQQSLDVPGWVGEFNDRRLLDAHFGSSWEPLPVDEEVLEAMDVVTLDEGVFQRHFPHRIGDPTLEPGSGFYGDLWDTPFVDSYLEQFVEALVDAEDLGADDHVDYLGVGFSGLDIVGHDYGPNSREVLDTVLRLDRTLRELLDFLDRRIGLDRVIVALGSDHGVVPLPELRQLRGEAGERMGVDHVTCVQRIHEILQERYPGEDFILEGLYLDHDAIEEAGESPDAVAAEIAALLRECPGVANVWTRAQLTEPDPWDEDPFRQRYENSFHPERSADLLVRHEPYFLGDGAPGTTHGSPYDYDSHVAMILRVPGVPPGTVGERVRTVDLAPTLAALLGVEAPEGLDGRDLRPLLGGF